MKFYKKYRGLLLIFAIAAVVTAALVGGGLFKKAEDVTASGSNGNTSINGTMMQYFEWYLPNDGEHWNRVADRADDLANAGFTALWLPPAYKGTSSNDVGYGPYDLYDLGEFNQKGTVRTKYGTRAQYLNAINTLHNNGLQVYADIVLNHKAGADTTETVSAVQVQYGNRNYTQSGTYDIAAWTVFNFPGRGDKYSSFKWNASCFDGVDYDNNQRTNAVFRFANKNWDWQVDNENANYDYLMYADVDFDSTYVVDELKSWGKWYVETANLDGFRLDAVKHIKFSFFSDWLTTLRQNTGKELFSVGEYWSYDLGKLKNYISETNGTTSLFDVPLHMNFYNASNGNGGYDMRNLFANTLVTSDASHAVTFVDNHDTQPGQSLQSFVADWFKPLAYTAILTRQDGYPCVFYGDYYGLASGGSGAVFKDSIDKLMQARTKYAYGTQHDYFDDANIIGWTREGDTAHANSGLAALITDGAGGSKNMYVGTGHAGEKWYDITGNVSGTVTIGSNGYGKFSVNGGSNSVWVPSGAAGGGSVETTTPALEGDNEVTIYYKNSWTNTYAHYQVGNGTWTDAPGVKMEDVTSDYAKITIDMGGATTVTACFNNGANTWDNNGNNNYTFNPGTFTLNNGKVTSGAPAALTEATTKEETTTQKETTTKEETTTQKETTTEEETTTKEETTEGASNSLTVYYYNNWSNSYLHYKVGNGTWTPAPGVKMEDVSDDYAMITVDMGSASNVTACFNNGSGTWDNNGNSDYTFEPGTYTVKNGKITEGEPAVQKNEVTIYYYNSWSKTYAHYQVGSGAWTDVPGVRMEDVTSSYAKITIDMGTASTVTACFNNGSSRWDNNYTKNYTLNAGTYTIKNKKITSGAPSL